MCDAREPHIKAKSRANTEEAQAAGIFGAPSFTTGSGELFGPAAGSIKLLRGACVETITSLAT
jgi:hypothetical protein